MEKTFQGKTVYVIPHNGGWTVKREGTKGSTVFSTQKDAVTRARSIAKHIIPGQIVVYNKDGRVASVYVRGLPKIQKPPVKSSLGARKIQKAVFEIVRNRLEAAEAT